MKSDATLPSSYKCKYNDTGKGTAKSNAELNFFSTIGVIQPYGKSKCRSYV